MGTKTRAEILSALWDQLSLAPLPVAEIQEIYERLTLTNLDVLRDIYETNAISETIGRAIARNVGS